jgi:chromatin remodeling complex protein RSC6
MATSKAKKKPMKKTTAAKKPAAKKTTAAKKPAAASRKTTRAKGKGGAANSAFMKPMQPSAALAKVVGEAPQPRSEVTKRVWAYIKKNGLQDAKDRRSINADATLGPVFGGNKKVTMFELTKHVNKHLS